MDASNGLDHMMITYNYIQQSYTSIRKHLDSQILVRWYCIFPQQRQILTKPFRFFHDTYAGMRMFIRFPEITEVGCFSICVK